MVTPARQTPLQTARRKPRLAELMRQGIRATKLELSVAYPCEVIKFYPDTQLVDVVVDFNQVRNLDTIQKVKGLQAQSLDSSVRDSQVVLEGDEMRNILVSFEGQGRVGGGYLSFPIEEGDKGYVTVFDRSVDRWISNGEGGDPGLSHTHNRIDGVFKPVRDITRAIPNFDGEAAVIEHSEIKLGKDATLAAARKTDTVKAGTTPVIAPALNMAAWIGVVTTFINGIAMGTISLPVDFGEIDSGSTKVKIE